MHNHHPSARRGFTLIELSIVLVILGLALAAIVTANSLRKSGRLQALVREQEAYVNAYTLFREKYSAKPGDFPLGYTYFAGGVDTICGTDTNNNGGCNGDGNGTLGGNDADFAETVRAWTHLQLAGVVPPSFTFTGSYYHPPLNATPHVKNLSENTRWMFFTPATDADWPGGQAFGRTGSWLLLGRHYEPGGYGGPWFALNSAISPQDASNIDLKVDDGYATTGKVTAVRGHDASGTACEASGTAWGAMDTIIRPYEYTFTSNAATCIMFFSVDE